MITLQNVGAYRLIQTKKHHTKILYLENISYAWVKFENIGEVLIVSHKDYPQECTLSTGRYMLYKVQSERSLRSGMHLELQVGQDKWQGYLIPDGLPDNRRIHTRIIPVGEVVTSNTLYDKREGLEMSLSNA